MKKALLNKIPSPIPQHTREDAGGRCLPCKQIPLR